MSPCSDCGKSKNSAEFGKHRLGENGLNPRCKVCVNKRSKVYYNSNKLKVKLRCAKWKNENREKIREVTRIWYSKNKDRVKDKYLRRTYGINLEYYKDLLRKQDERCAICKLDQREFKKDLVVDHCHFTGEIRGLLCESCNINIGRFKENPRVLRSAAEYVERLDYTGRYIPKSACNEDPYRD